MRFAGVIVGMVVAAILLGLLALTRLLVPEPPMTQLEIREVELASLPDPPPPPPEDPPPEDPPPPPALVEISAVPDASRIAMPKANAPRDLTLPVDPFALDLAPAPLPKPAPRKVVRQTRPAVTAPTPAPRKAKPKPAPPAPAKSHYQVGELDGKPRLLRHGSAVFPSSLARRGVTSGTVVFEVELSTGGSVRVRRVVSATDNDLVAAARRVAKSAKFTAPKRQGRPVKAILNWPITIRK